MSRATYPLKLPRLIKDAAARLAKEDGVSLNQWIAGAVAQKVGTIETAAEFVERGSIRSLSLAPSLTACRTVSPSAGMRCRRRKTPEHAVGEKR